MERFSIPPDDYYTACLKAGRDRDFNYLNHLINSFEVKSDGLAYPKVRFAETKSAEYTLTFDIR